MLLHVSPGKNTPTCVGKNSAQSRSVASGKQPAFASGDVAEPGHSTRNVKQTLLLMVAVIIEWS